MHCIYLVGRALVQLSIVIVSSRKHDSLWAVDSVAYVAFIRSSIPSKSSFSSNSVLYSMSPSLLYSCTIGLCINSYIGLESVTSSVLSNSSLSTGLSNNGSDIELHSPAWARLYDSRAAAVSSIAGFLRFLSFEGTLASASSYGSKSFLSSLVDSSCLYCSPSIISCSQQLYRVGPLALDYNILVGRARVQLGVPL